MEGGHVGPLCSPRGFCLAISYPLGGPSGHPSSVSVEFAALDNYLSACLLQPELEAYLAEDVALGHLAKVHISQGLFP
jgi:hypothetical protein